MLTIIKQPINKKLVNPSLYLLHINIISLFNHDKNIFSFLCPLKRTFFKKKTLKYFKI